MKKLKIFIKDVEAFIQKEMCLYASEDNKRFYVRLHAGPMVPRYVVTILTEDTSVAHEFIKRGEAVRFFNDN